MKKLVLVLTLAIYTAALPAVLDANAVVLPNNAAIDRMGRVGSRAAPNFVWVVMWMAYTLVW